MRLLPNTGKAYVSLAITRNYTLLSPYLFHCLYDVLVTQLDYNQRMALRHDGTVGSLRPVNGSMKGRVHQGPRRHREERLRRREASTGQAIYGQATAACVT